MNSLLPYFLFQFSSVAQSFLTLHDPMDCSMPGVPVHHQLLEFIQIHVHWVGDAIQSSHPLSSPSPPAFNLSQHQPRASCILHRTWTGDSFLMWYYTCFNAILPNHHPPPSPTESRRLFYISVSLLLSRIQGYRYHLSKFHIYALVYCIGVFLSGLLHFV